MSRLIKSTCVVMPESAKFKIRNPAQEQAEAEEKEAMEQEMLVQAEQVLEESRQQAADIIKTAEKEASSIISSAKKEAEGLKKVAYEEGVSKGTAEGKKKSNALLAKHQQEHEQLIEDEKKRLINRYNELEEQVLMFALDVSKKILGVEIDTNKQAYVSMVEKAISELKSGNSVVVRTSPDNLEAFTAQPLVVSSEHGAVTADVQADSELTSYDAIIESEYGTIDAGFEAQFQRLSDTLGEINAEE